MKYLKELLKHDEALGVKHSKAILRAFDKHKRIHERALAGKYIYKPERVESAIKFIEHEFYTTTGVLDLIKLQPAQKWWLELWFGYYTLSGDVLINETFLNIIRGAGKSTLMAAVETLWLIYGGAFGGESVVIARDNNQAAHVFDQVRNQISSGDGLLHKLGDEELLKTTKTGIVFKPNKNTFRKQTNDIYAAQGGNSSLNLFDEVHTYKDDIVSAINKGSRQKQSSWRSIYITSGGIVRDALYDSLIERFKSDVEFESDRSIGLIYQLDDPEEVTDEINWSKAAPMIYDGLPKLEAVRDEYNIAKDDPALQTQFLAYNMGVAMNNATKYILEDEARCTPYDFADIWTGADVNIGVDLSLVGDLTAVAFVTEKDGKQYAHVEAIASRGTLPRMGETTQRLLQTMPNLTITHGDIITSHDVFDVVRSFVDKYNITLLNVGYDRARYENLHVLIDNYFFDVEEARQFEIRQGFAMSDYIKLLKQRLQDKTIIHNCPILQWSLLNFAVKIGYSGDVMAMKLNDDEKIDPVVALIMAIAVTVKTY